MDYYSGGDLFALVEKQPYNRLPESSAKYYVNQCKARDNRVACRDCNGLAWPPSAECDISRSKNGEYLDDKQRSSHSHRPWNEQSPSSWTTIDELCWNTSIYGMLSKCHKRWNSEYTFIYSPRRLLTVAVMIALQITGRWAFSPTSSWWELFRLTEIVWRYDLIQLNCMLMDRQFFPESQDNL